MPSRTDPPDWLDELYSSGPAEEPPQELDEAIRGAAADAVAPHRPKPGPGWIRQPARLAGLAMAAAVVLAIGVLLLSRVPRPQEAGELRLAKTEAAATSRNAASPEPAAPPEQAVVTASRAIADRQSDEAAQISPSRPVKLVRSPGPEVGAANAALEPPKALSRSLDVAQASPPPAASAGARALTIEDLTPSERSSISSLEPGAEDCAKSEFFDSGGSDPYALCTHEDGTRDLRHADCRTPYPIPDAAVVQATDDAVAVTHDGAVTTVSCHVGAWLTSNDQPDP